MFNIKVENGMVDARNLHSEIESKKKFAGWITEFIKRADLIEGSDFYPLQGKSTGGRPQINYSLTIKAAQEICLLQQNEKSKKLRRYLLEIGEQKQNKELISRKEAAFAMLLINTLQFETFQKDAEVMHKNRFSLTNKAKGNIHKLFADYRNDLLDISNKRLKDAMVEQCLAGNIQKATAKNIRRRIYMLDRYKLIRDAVVDLLVSRGFDTWEALQFAEVVKEMAEHANIEIKIHDEDSLIQQKVYAVPPSEIKMIN